MTAVPSPTFGPNGFITPTEPEILAGVQSDLNTAFGGNLNPALETPQGQLATSLAAIIGDKNDEFLAYVNGVDPAFAEGRMQDAIARIYFLSRNPATPTTVNAVCSGAAGTSIPLGSLAVATDGLIYESTAAATIGGGGTVTVPFACTETGPIACPISSLVTIYRAVPGWDSIENLVDGVPGRDVEGRADFELRRSLSVAANSVNQLISIRGAVLNVPDVTDAYVTDNSTAGSVTVGGVTLAAYNLYVAAVGGNAQAIAQAIWSKKPPGVPYYAGAGSTAYTVEDTSDGYSPPYPSYSVRFVRPTNLPILFAVSITDGTAVPSDAVDQVRNAILDAFNGVSGPRRARIGATLYASQFVSAVAALGTWAQEVISLQIGTATPNADTVTVGINQMPTLATGDIAVTLV